MGIRTGLLMASLGVGATGGWGQAAQATVPASATILNADAAGAVLPDQVFFRGQSATVQKRNSGGVKYQDGMFVLAVLVDTGGYSSAAQQKYQGFLIAEEPLEIEGQRLPPGEYGFGFVQGNKFLVMDVGAHTLLTAADTRDSELRRAVPLQIVSAPGTDGFRLYSGRNYVVFARGK